MNGLSLFSGIGGLDLGLERAGVQVVGQVEIDPYCQRVLAKHWPDVPRHDDVRTAAAWWQTQERPHVDVIFGGFPCQDISSAGRKRGIGGEKSGLWAAFAATIRDLRPRYVLMENVADILGRGLGRVLGDLAEIGYDAEWDCAPAAAVGAPHLRDRWFAVAYPQGRSDPDQPPGGHRPAFAAGAVAGTGGGTLRWAAAAGDHVPSRGGGVVVPAVAHAAGQGWGHEQPDGSVAGDGRAPVRTGAAEPGRRCGTGRVFQRPGDRGWPAEPRVGRLAYGVPAGVVRPQLRGYGNAVVPQVAEWMGRLLMSMEDAA